MFLSIWEEITIFLTLLKYCKKITFLGGTNTYIFQLIGKKMVKYV